MPDLTVPMPVLACTGATRASIKMMMCALVCIGAFIGLYLGVYCSIITVYIGLYRGRIGECFGVSIKKKACICSPA